VRLTRLPCPETFFFLPALRRKTASPFTVNIPEHPMQKQKTLLDLQRMKSEGEKIAVLTCYDYPTATIMDRCGIDMILIGDSGGVVVAGYDNTLPVTMEEMLYHTKAVMRARPKALVVADMPFLSYQTDLATARYNAGILIKRVGRPP